MKGTAKPSYKSCTGSGRRGTYIYCVDMDKQLYFWGPSFSPISHRTELDALYYYMTSIGLWMFASIMSLNPPLTLMRLIFYLLNLKMRKWRSREVC